ncbi:MAG: hypothetical protein AAF824_06550 [Bacteroidota bacterium]
MSSQEEYSSGVLFYLSQGNLLKYSWFYVALAFLLISCSNEEQIRQNQKAIQQAFEASLNEFRADSLQNYLVALYADPQIRARMNAKSELIPSWRLLKEPGHSQSKSNSQRASVRADKLQDHISLLYADPVIQNRMVRRRYLIPDRQGFLPPPSGPLDTLYPETKKIQLLPLPERWLDGKVDIPPSDQTAETSFKLDFGSIIFWEAFKDSLSAIPELRDITISEQPERIQLSVEGSDLFMVQSDSMSEEGYQLLSEFYYLLTKFPEIHDAYTFTIIRDTTTDIPFALGSLMRGRSRKLQLAFQNRGILAQNVRITPREFKEEERLDRRKLLALYQRFTIKIEAK